MRTRADLMDALTWRRGGTITAVIGAPRYRWVGISAPKWHWAVHSSHALPVRLKSESEVESAIASMIAAQPVAARLL